MKLSQKATSGEQKLKFLSYNPGLKTEFYISCSNLPKTLPDFAKLNVLPNFLSKPSNFFTRIYPPYLWHFANLHKHINRLIHLDKHDQHYHLDHDGIPGGRRLWFLHGWSSCQWRSQLQPKKFFSVTFFWTINQSIDFRLWDLIHQHSPWWHVPPIRTRSLWGLPHPQLIGADNPCTRATWHSFLQINPRKYKWPKEDNVLCWSFVFLVVEHFGEGWVLVCACFPHKPHHTVFFLCDTSTSALADSTTDRDFFSNGEWSVYLGKGLWPNMWTGTERMGFCLDFLCQMRTCKFDVLWCEEERQQTFGQGTRSLPKQGLLGVSPLVDSHFASLISTSPLLLVLQTSQIFLPNTNLLRGTWTHYRQREGRVI